MSWSTSELRVRLAPWNRFKPSSKIFLLTVSRRYFFCGSFVLFMSCVFHAFAFVHCCLVVTCWEWTDLLTLVCDVYFVLCYFPMWYPGSGVILDCFDSRSLPPFLLFPKDRKLVFKRSILRYFWPSLSYHLSLRPLFCLFWVSVLHGVYCMWHSSLIIEPMHEISNNVVHATSKASDQPAHKRSLIRAFASRLSILWVLSY